MIKGSAENIAETSRSELPTTVDVRMTADANEKSVDNPKPEEKTTECSDSEKKVKMTGGDIVATYKGVQWDRKNNRWRARLHTDRTRHVGYFSTEEDAARAWDQALLRFTCGQETIKKLNFPEESFAKFKEFLDHEGDLDGYDLRGVVKNETQPGKFSAHILHNRQQINVGTFGTAREAAVAYDWKSIQFFGWGSLTNFPLANYEVEYIRTGGISPLDGSVLPAFPNHRRFMESEKAIQDIDPSEQVQFGVGKRGRFEQQQPSPVTSPIFVGNPPKGSPLDPNLAQLLQHSGLNFNYNPFVQYPVAHGRHFVDPRSQAVLFPKAGLASTQLGHEPNSETIIKVGEQQWKSIMSVDLGDFNSHELAKDACDRAKLAINGYSAFSPTDLAKHLKHVEQTSEQLKEKIKEKNGVYYIALRINSRGFELGPYKTVEEARIAHDKYSLLIDGGKAKTFMPLIDILLGNEEAKNLLYALNVDLQETTPAQPVIGASVQLPQSSILANAYTTTLRKVASQASMHEEGQEFNKKLEKIQSSIEGIGGVARPSRPANDVTGVQDTQPQAGQPPTSCPLPPFPQRSPSSIENINNNDNLPDTQQHNVHQH